MKISQLKWNIAKHRNVNFDYPCDKIKSIFKILICCYLRDPILGGTANNST